MPHAGARLGDHGQMHAETGATAGDLDLDRLGRAEAELAAVEHALGRLDAGTWGTCEACGGPIEAASLDRRPGARTCDAHTPPHRAGPPEGASAPPDGGGAPPPDALG